MSFWALVNASRDGVVYENSCICIMLKNVTFLESKKGGRSMFKRILIVVTIIVLSVAMAATALADIPQLISFQGNDVVAASL